ncbi:MAG: diguanylate cyclase [Actinomycetota bacterium]|nr:diguanylate cyclase [Actinomycetota bacterium]
MAFLWLNALALPIYGLVSHYRGGWHDLAHAAGLLPFAVLASSGRFSMKLRSVFLSVGLLSAAALLVHLTGGLIEAHFYFFVLIVALTLYEDWLPFLVAVGYVLVHHGLMGTLNPHEVYNRPEEWAHPWVWAGIHASFIALAGVAGVIAWRLNEDVRNRMRAAQIELAKISETDSLTQLSNRRKAMSDLEAAFGATRGGSVLVVLDLDGFKSYNDTFGHPAGDALLRRLGHRLAAAVGGRATAYRLGGDEFCVLGGGSSAERASLEAASAAALSERGEGFSVAASYGSVLIPVEAGSAEEAMQTSDSRMYAHKQSSRPSALSQSKDVLLKALAERHPELNGHSGQVCELTELVARELGLPDDQVQPIRHAADLHDIGKVAIPDAIVNKPGPLDEPEWEFMRRHTVIGQRIVVAAPVLSFVGELIRSSHEYWNGAGYPDGLSAEEIPLGARIICACDAYDAMVSDRPYRLARSSEEALAELRRCAGTQFDPTVVAALVRVLNLLHELSLMADPPGDGCLAPVLEGTLVEA